MLTLAIANQKGGVGKTTSAVNLGYLLANAGKRVLAMDCDPQASLTVYYGQDQRALEERQATLYYALLKDRPIEELVIPGREPGTPDLIPSSIRLATAEAELVSLWDSAGVLREKLAPIVDRYDFILIDCPPTLTLLTVNALAAAQSVLIPVKTDYLSIMGIQLFLETVGKIQQKANRDLSVLGVLPTMFNPRASHDNEALAELHKTLEPEIRVFEPINRSTNFDKAAVESRPTVEILPETPGAQGYRSLAEVILSSHG